jgi:serine/threonine-protein kinase
MSGAQPGAGAPFGKYRLIAKLATGGMGEIFLARLKGVAGFEKLVVIKRLLPHLAEDAHFVTMLLDEARIAARLSHPNVCEVYDLGEVDGQFYIAMEYLEGVSCSQVLQRARKEGRWLDIRLAAAVLIQACEGLHHAHELTDRNGGDIGLVHRDISPSNLFLTTTGLVKVLDFGVAKSRNALARTHTGALKGKYAYMSPEQVMAQPIDRRSDIFSLGIVFWEMLTTQRLFWRESEFLMFQAIAEEEIPPVTKHRENIPEAVAETVQRALARDQAARFGTARDLAEAIRAAVQTLGGVVSNSKLGDYVKTRFEESIRERREVVSQAAGGEDGEARAVSAYITDSLPMLKSGVSRSELRSVTRVDDHSPEDAATRVSPTLKPVVIKDGRTDRRRSLIPVLAVLLSLTILATGGLVFLAYSQAHGDADREEIVIVADRVKDGAQKRASKVVAEDAEEAPSEDNPARAPDAGSSGSSSGTPRRAPDAGSSGSSSGTPRDLHGNGPHALDKPRARRIDEIIAERRKELRECANRFVDQVQGHPTVLVSFEIDARGRPTTVHLNKGLSDLPYGKCVVDVVNGLRFSSEYAEQHVEIPLHIRTVRKEPP